jgi:hypothetical protein
MRCVLVSACALIAAAAASRAGASPIEQLRPLGSSMTAATTPTVAGARHVRLTLAMHYEMQCGYPGAGPLVVVLPNDMSLPTRLPSGSVLVNGNPLPATIAHARVTVSIPPHTGVMCDSIGPGTLRLTLTRQAGFGNPARAGTYRLTAAHARRAFSTNLKISAN